MGHGGRVKTGLASAGLAALSVLGALGIVEGLLRLADYRFPPVAFLAPDRVMKGRAFIDPRVSLTVPVLEFDSELLWKLNPAVSPEIDARGFRGGGIPERRPTGEVLIVALGDSNTLGGLHAPDHWPGLLQDLVRMQPARRPVRVVNAGVFGYTAFQGLERFRQLLRFRPDLVYFCFGSADAEPALTSDAERARLVGWLRGWQWLRLAPPAAYAVWRGMDWARAARTPARRVAPDGYRHDLEEFVELARAHGVSPILLTRPCLGGDRELDAYNALTRNVAAAKGAALVDVEPELRGARELFVDATHFNRLGNRRMAELLLAHLKQLGVVERDDVRSYAAGVDLGAADDRALELGPGWWGRERWSDGRAGRWTAGDATLFLERHDVEGGLLLDLSAQSTAGAVTGSVEANGLPISQLDLRSGRTTVLADIRRVPGRQLTVRLVVDHPTSTTNRTAGGDERTLGVFVHDVRLVASPAGATPRN